MDRNSHIMKLRTKTGYIDLKGAMPSWHSLKKKQINTAQINAFSKNGRKFSNAGWREIGGQKYYMRSKWEANFGRYLQWLKENQQIQNWYHEPTTFWFPEIKRGVRSYLPDFQVIESKNSWYWVEVKGYYDSKSLTKIKRFRKYYPTEKLRLIDKSWFSKTSSTLRMLILEWE